MALRRHLAATPAPSSRHESTAIRDEAESRELADPVAAQHWDDYLWHDDYRRPW